MPRIEGKTINELLRVEDITGAEIIPMSVWSEEYNSYVTRGITVDNFFKTIYGMIQEAEQNISYVQDDMNAYVNELRAYDANLHAEDVRLNKEIGYTNTTLAYHAEHIMHLHDHYCQITAYSYENVGELWDNIGDTYSYAHEGIGMLDERTTEIAAYAEENIGQLHNDVEGIASYAYENVGYLGELIITSYDRLDERISYEHDWNLAYMAISYDKLDRAIAYVAAYAEGGTGELAYIVKELHAYAYDNIGDLHVSYDDLRAYTYAGIGWNSYVNVGQDVTLAQHAQAIHSLAANIAYESYVNTIQSGHINTIYYENSDDAFNDWSNPDDDNVKPQK